MKKTIKKYRIPANIALIAALIFLAISIFVWFSLGLHAFGNKEFLINDSNLQQFYQIGLISTTITFGLFTVYFALRSSQNSFSEKQTNLMVRINDYLSEFMEFISSPTYVYFSVVSNEMISTFNLQNTIDNYDNLQDDFWKVCQDLFMNSPYNLPDVLVNSSKKNIAISTNDGNCPNWFNTTKNIDNKVFEYFISRLLKVSNCLEALSYPYINETIDEEIFEEQVLPYVRLSFIVSLIFEKLGVIEHIGKSISYQALKKYKEKCDIIKAKKKGEK